MTNILYIPDAHAIPSQNNDRFSWLGNYVVAKKPDVVICAGDWAEMESLSSYDIGKKSFEGRRYKKDIQSAIEAQENFFKPLRDYNQKMKEQHKARYSPTFYMTLGNHEYRIQRAINDDPKLDGTIGLEDLELESFGWNVLPFKEILFQDGIAFSHYFTNRMDRALSSEDNLARILLNKKHMSCVQGHTHQLNVSNSTLPTGKRIWGIVGGCYFDYHQDWISKAVQDSFWRGVVFLSDAKEGDFNPYFIPLDHIKEKYAESTKDRELLNI